MLKENFTTKRLCFQAIMIALFAVLDMLAIPLGNNMKITFGGLPIIIAAVYYGPVSGTLVGLIGAFVGQMLTYGFSATTLLWILPAGIRGLTMGLLFIAFKRSRRLSLITVEVLITSLLVTAANTFVMYADSKIFHYYSFALIFGVSGFRLLASVITALVYSVLLIPIFKALDGKM